MVEDVLNGEEDLFNLQDDAFIDAEKFSLTLDGYDTYLCWAVAAADMLWMSVW